MSTAQYVHRKDDTIILLISALVITSVLYLIDHKVASIEWIQENDAALLILFFAVFIFISEVFVSNVLLRRFRGVGPTCLSIAVGSLIGIVFVLEVVLKHW